MGLPHRTEKQLADAVSAEVHVSVRAGRDFLRHLLEAIADDLVANGRVELRGLGTFSVSTRKARKALHPGTGKPIKIAESKFVRYRSATAIRRRLNPKPPPKAAKGADQVAGPAVSRGGTRPPAKRKPATARSRGSRSSRVGGKKVGRKRSG